LSGPDVSLDRTHPSISNEQPRRRPCEFKDPRDERRQAQSPAPAGRKREQSSRGAPAVKTRRTRVCTMNIHEYQAKQLLKKYGVRVPEGRLVEEGSNLAGRAEKAAQD